MIRAAASAVLLACAAPELREPSRAGWLASIQAGLEAREYEASRNTLGLQAPNRVHNLRSYFEPEGLRVHDRTAAGSPELLSLRLTSIGRGEQGRAVEPGVVESEGSRVEIRRPGLVEWYQNSPQGLEQGFLLEQSPAGSGELWLELHIEGARARARGAGLELLTGTGRRLRYDKLFVQDAEGRPVPARMELGEASKFRLVVADAGAAYPLTIDPLLTAVADTLLESNQAGARLGYSVAAAGDVNGDGYGDLIIGAEGYDAGQSNEGAAFVFLGSASGIADGTTASAAAMIESDDENAGLGESVAGAGDVNGDGYDDVIVGASGYLHPGGTVDGGAAFVFLGSATGIASGNPASAATRILPDPGAGGALGRSVAGAGDVNGDGYADVIVGAPTYPFPLENRGAAFLFLGSASGIADATPATAATWLESPQGGQFGASVAGAGDVNGDGYDDVIIGAFGYSSGQSGGGSAFVYLGSASGIPDGTPATADTHLDSNDNGARLGSSVAGAGDVNGDGYADVIVGANLYSVVGNVNTNHGAAFIFHGSASGIADGTPETAATQIIGDEEQVRLGSSVAGAGDVNGDGYADVIIGAAEYSDPESNQGAAFVFLGGPAGIASGTNADADVEIQSDEAGGRMGWSVAGAGDVNGDGFADVVVGAPATFSTGGGTASVYLGGPTGISGGTPENAAAQIESNQALGGAWLGFSVASAGDVNGDGYADVIVGAPNYDSGEVDEGAAFVFLGSASGIGDGSPANAATQLESDAPAANLGWSVAGAGDVNGDGYADVIVGAYRYSAGQTAEGAAFVFLGSATGIADGTPASAAAQLESDQANARFGESVAGAGDVNGDGYADVIVGASSYNAGQASEGAAFVFHGGPSGVADGTPASADAQLESNQGGARLGISVAGAGDVNGDGYADVIVGASGYDAGQTDEGVAFVFHGGPSGIGDGTPANAATQLESNLANAHLGLSVAGAGDVNGDGYADVIVGAPFYNAGQANEGAAFVFLGSATGVADGTPASAHAQLESDQANANLGRSVAGAGDVNGDGYADVIVGAPNYDAGQSDEGAAFVFLGGAAGVADGTPASAAAQFESDQAIAFLGWSVAGAGDVNGDGYADVIVGSYVYDNGQTNEGAAFVFQPGNDGSFARPVLSRQLRPGLDAGLVHPFGASGSADSFRARMRATHPDGRGLVKLQVEACPPGIGFGGVSCTGATSPNWADSGANSTGIDLTATVTGLAPGTLYRWRGRVLHAPGSVAGGAAAAPANPPHGPWRRLGAQSVEGDVRTLGDPDADGDGVADGVDNCVFVANPGQEDDGGWSAGSPADGIGNACQCGNVAGSGRVDQTDVDAYRAFLADPSGAALSAAALTRCAVLGSSAACNVLQVVAIRRGLELPPLAPITSSTLAQVCDAALAP